MCTVDVIRTVPPCPTTEDRCYRDVPPGVVRVWDSPLEVRSPGQIPREPGSGPRSVTFPARNCLIPRIFIPEAALGETLGILATTIVSRAILCEPRPRAFAGCPSRSVFRVRCGSLQPTGTRCTSLGTRRGWPLRQGRRRQCEGDLPARTGTDRQCCSHGRVTAGIRVRPRDRHDGTTMDRSTKSDERSS